MRKKRGTEGDPPDNLAEAREQHRPCPGVASSPSRVKEKAGRGRPAIKIDKKIWGHRFQTRAELDAAIGEQCAKEFFEFSGRKWCQADAEIIRGEWINVERQRNRNAETLVEKLRTVLKDIVRFADEKSTPADLLAVSLLREFAPTFQLILQRFEQDYDVDSSCRVTHWADNKSRTQLIIGLGKGAFGIDRKLSDRELAVISLLSGNSPTFVTPITVGSVLTLECKAICATRRNLASTARRKMDV